MGFDLKEHFLKFLTKIPVLSKVLFNFSNHYMDEYRHFSYNMERNGETALIEHSIKILTEDQIAQDFIFFDVGANLGLWTENLTRISSFLAPTLKVEGHLFEISESTFVKLENSLKKDHRLTLNSKGLSDSCDVRILKDFGSGSGYSTLATGIPFHKSQYKETKVEVLSGKCYVEKADVLRINLLKIDVEGHEFSVIRGFEDLFRNNLIDACQFEYGFLNASEGALLNNIFAFFESCGYHVGRLTPAGVNFKKFEWQDNDFKSGPNYVACPETNFRKYIEF